MSKCTDLKQLLKDAIKAAHAAQPVGIRKVQDDLKDFANDTNDPPDKELQDIAVNTIIDLGVAALVDISDLLKEREKERAAHCSL